MRFETIEARPWHCGAISRKLRRDHAGAIRDIGIGSEIHRELRARFDASSIRRAFLIDGELAALGGVTGTILSPIGYVWLALADCALRHPLAIVREAKAQLAAVMKLKHELATTVLMSDDAGLRFAVFLGFHVADEGPGATATSRPLRHALVRFAKQDPASRIPFGRGAVIKMGYH